MKRLGNKTNQQISCCQTTIQEFGWWMKEDFLLRATRIDEGIPKKFCDGEDNVSY